jgi:predicted nucleic acid-binding protein
VIILDTNVLSEMMRPSPSPQVLRWASARPARQLFTTTLTQAEILCGVELLPKSKRRTGLESAVQAMFQEDFAGRILAFDSDAAIMFAKIAAARRALGRPIAQFDAQVAAIARSHGAAVATRDTSDFADCSIPVVNPWIDE